MNCQEFGEILDAMPLRDRDEARMREARRHAAQCPHCAALMDRMLKLERELGQLRQIAPSDKLLEAVMQRIEQEREPVRTSPAAGITWRMIAVGVGITALAGSHIQTADPSSLLNSLWTNRTMFEHIREFDPLSLAVAFLGAALILLAMLSQRANGDLTSPR